MRGVIFLDHLDAGAAVLGDLVDIRTLHQSQADVRMTQTVRCARTAFTIKAQMFLIQDGLKKFPLPFRKKQVGLVEVFASLQQTEPSSRGSVWACSRHKCAAKCGSTKAATTDIEDHAF